MFKDGLSDNEIQNIIILFSCIIDSVIVMVSQFAPGIQEKRCCFSD